VPPESETTAPFAPGVGTLLVRAEGYGWEAVRFDAAEARTTDVRVVVAQGGTVKGRIPEPPVPRKDYILLRRLDPWPEGVAPPGTSPGYGNVSGPQDYGSIQEDGSFVVKGVRPGAYDVEHKRVGEGRDHTLISSGRVQVRSSEEVVMDLPR
jgi:hypothetical protein